MENNQDKITITLKDNFVVLMRNGVKINDNIYSKIDNDIYYESNKYIILHKQTKDGFVACIIDVYGNEKFVSDTKYGNDFSIIEDSCLLLTKFKIYNIETKFCYGMCDYSRILETKNNVIVELNDVGYSDIPTLKINKSSGSFEIID